MRTQTKQPKTSESKLEYHTECDCSQLSDWLDNQLEQLVKRNLDFFTPHSLVGSDSKR